METFGQWFKKRDKENEAAECILDALQDYITVEGVFDPVGNMEVFFDTGARIALIKLLKEMGLM